MMKTNIPRCCVSGCFAVALTLFTLQATASTKRTPRYQREDSLCVVQLLTNARQMPRQTCWPLYLHPS